MKILNEGKKKWWDKIELKCFCGFNCVLEEDDPDPYYGVTCPTCNSLISLFRDMVV
jgi:hypothetical protein